MNSSSPKGQGLPARNGGATDLIQSCAHSGWVWPLAFNLSGKLLHLTSLEKLSQTSRQVPRAILNPIKLKIKTNHYGGWRLIFFIVLPKFS